MPTISANVPLDVHKQAKAAAAKCNISLRDWAGMAVTYFAGLKQKPERAAAKRKAAK